MEFNQQLIELRKKKGLTQEELGAILFVSRTAISKWESGRGYPNLDTLKTMSKFFGVTVDELLSCDQLLSVAEQDGKQKENNILDLVFAVMDIAFILFLILPLFAQTVDGVILEVSLINLTEKQLYLKIAYFVVVILSVLLGILQLFIRKNQNKIYLKYKRKISLALGTLSVILFSVSLQPYAVILSFLFLSVKVLTIIKL